MKLSNLCCVSSALVLASSSSSVSAFSIQQQQSTTKSTTALMALPSLSSSRRDVLLSSSSSMLVLLGISAATPDVACAGEVDYSKIQDLLGKPDGPSVTTKYSDPSSGGPRPTYLMEPTAEFKENEQKAAAFKRLQLQQKKAFLDLLEHFEADTSNNEASFLNDLDSMRRLVKQYGGLPLGITKDELVKRIRRKKAKKFWPTNVEIAYQDLLSEIMFQQSPNTDRDMDNPF